VHPGDTIRLTLVNELGPNPAVTGNVMNTFHYPNTTNMHTHGLHISGESPGDDVFRTCEPGQTEVRTHESSVDPCVGGVCIRVRVRVRVRASPN
jgi:FtsP/CotA-like multicopper oxidase with cupredoxin domain